jgi:HK97 family phage prohead protease
MPQSKLNLPGLCQRSPVVVREQDKPTQIEGYGAVFYRADDPGTEYWLWDDVVERILPGAFDRALTEDDVRSFFNHDPNLILGRTSANTLTLRVDATGLFYSVTPPDSEAARHVVSAIERGDVNGSSFMFVPRKTAWEEIEQEDRTLYVRNIQDVELWEVGAVVFPAYSSTTAGTRSKGKAGQPPRSKPISPTEIASFRGWLDGHIAEARSEFADYRRMSDRARRQRRVAALLK